MTPAHNEPIGKKIDHAKERKHEAQADLRKVTELHAPKGARAAARKLRRALKRVVIRWTDRIAVLRKRRDAKKRDPLRKKIVAWWEWAISHEPEIHYLQHRPYQSDPRKLPMSEDCSATTTLSYKDAGAPDPNGFAFNGYGYTGTIRSNCETISFSAVKRGDPIVYGPGAGSHVVVAAEDAAGKSDIQVYSHGQEAGPLKIAHSIEARVHGGYFTCHRCIND